VTYSYSYLAYRAARGHIKTGIAGVHLTIDTPLAFPYVEPYNLIMTSTIREQILTRGYSFVESLNANRDSVSVAVEIGKVMTPWEGGVVQ
jgi:hypothetical protein